MTDFEDIIEHVVREYIFEKLDDTKMIAMNKRIVEELKKNERVQYAYTTFHPIKDRLMIEGHVFILLRGEDTPRPSHTTVKFQMTQPS